MTGRNVILVTGLIDKLDLKILYCYPELRDRNLDRARIEQNEYGMTTLRPQKHSRVLQNGKSLVVLSKLLTGYCLASLTTSGIYQIRVLLWPGREIRRGQGELESTGFCECKNL